MVSILPDAKPISWAVYPPEYILAEKLETFITRASANSRAKDIFDINLLFDLCQKPKAMMEAIQKTFKNRKTMLPDSFFKFAKEINHTILKPAWTAVQLMEGSVSFDESWAQFVKNMKKLDSV
jgi:predicted nucleotidyltransferase component of viral defense system